MSLGISLLSVDEMRELCRIADEEDRSVVVHPIPDTFLRLDLHGKSTRITSGIRGSALTTDRAESDSGRCLLSNGCKKGVGGDIGQVVSDFKVSVSTSTLGVDDTLRDSLAIEVSEEIDVVEV